MDGLRAAGLSVAKGAPSWVQVTREAAMLRRLVVSMVCATALWQGAPVVAQETAQETALLAGGCFWCVESDFRRVQGVLGVTVGFAGGELENPSYDTVVRGGTGHLEAALVTYDPAHVSYAQILHLFMRSIDPLDDGGQFCDRGAHYTTAVFASEAQMPAARAALERASAALGQPVVTALRPLARFWPAEDFHQGYAYSDSIVITRFGPIPKRTAYRRYREPCGRDARVEELWGEDAPFVSR